MSAKKQESFLLAMSELVVSSGCAVRRIVLSPDETKETHRTKLSIGFTYRTKDVEISTLIADLEDTNVSTALVKAIDAAKLRIDECIKTGLEECPCCEKPTYKAYWSVQPEDPNEGACSSCGFHYSSEFKGSQLDQGRDWKDHMNRIKSSFDYA